MDITMHTIYAVQYQVSNSFEQRIQSRGENLVDQHKTVLEVDNQHDHGDKVTVSEEANNMSRQRNRQPAPK